MTGTVIEEDLSSISPVEKVVQYLKALLSNPPFNDLNYRLEDRESSTLGDSPIFTAPTVLRLDLKYGINECEPIMLLSSYEVQQDDNGESLGYLIAICFERIDRTTILPVKSISDIDRDFAKNILFHIIIGVLSIDEHVDRYGEIKEMEIRM